MNLAPLLSALMLVESAGNPSAVNGRAVGCLQVTPAVLADVHRVYGITYPPAARYSPAASRQIASLYLHYWGKRRGMDPQTLAGIWRKGPNGYRSDTARRYAERVCNLMEAESCAR